MDSHSIASSSYKNDFTITIYAKDAIAIYDSNGKTQADLSVTYYDTKRVELNK